MTMTLSGTTGVTTPASVNFNNVPAFSAYLTIYQNIPNGSSTKVIYDGEEFDTNNSYNTSTGVFQPNVAGYYQINATSNYTTSVDTAVCVTILYKNGAAYKVGTEVHASTNKVISSGVSSIIYMNGTTDYVEVYTFQDTGSTQPLSAGVNIQNNYFNACLVRSA